MLRHLHIKSFGIIQNISLDVHPKLTTITGETGSGKSVLMDAILFALNLPTHRPPDITPHSSVTLTFDIPPNHPVRQWFNDSSIHLDEECMIRRSATSQQRTRTYVNDQPISQAQLKKIAPLLMQISGQNSHQSLMQPKAQRQILDDLGQLLPLQQTVAQAYQEWFQLNHQYETLQNQYQSQQDQQNLLTYQCDELDELALSEDEVDQLLQEDKQFQHIEQVNEHLLQLYHACDQLSPVIQSTQLDQWKTIFPDLDNSLALKEQLSIILSELCHEIKNLTSSLDANPKRLQEIQQRLSQCHDLARKHRVDVRQLYSHQLQLLRQKEQLSQLDHDLALCKKSLNEALQTYQKQAKNLSEQRQVAANKLIQKINHQLKHIGMPHGVFEVRLSQSQMIRAHGYDEVEFWIQTNPGQPMTPISESVSGGELSRLSLLLKTMLPQPYPTCHIFDEVDTGIGGSVANIIARLLHQVSIDHQALCITHLPQVAACGQNQWHVTKHQTKQATESKVSMLTLQQRIHHLATLMSGLKPTEASLQEARHILDQWHSEAIEA